jgi:hypothetical protein
MTAVIVFYLNNLNVEINANVSIVGINSLNIIFNNFLKNNSFLLLGIAYGMVGYSDIM